MEKQEKPNANRSKNKTEILNELCFFLLKKLREFPCDNPLDPCPLRRRTK